MGKAASRAKGGQNRRRSVAASTTPRAVSPASSRKVEWLNAGAALVIVVLTCVAYIPALGGGYLLDDEVYVTENATLRSADGLRRIWFEPASTAQYYPLVFTTFWVEHRLWGHAALGYHATNIVLHAVNALLVWTLLRRLSVPGALLAALIFALHPVHVASVAWITERKNVLSGMFCLLTLLVWLRYLEARRWRLYALAVILFAAAMLSKTSACMLPFVLLLVAWWQKPSAWRRELGPALLFLGVAVPLALVTRWREHLYGNAPLTLPYLDRVLVAGRAVCFYAWRIVWPTNLTVFYPRWEVDSAAPWQYVFPLAVLAVLALLCVLRQWLGRAPLVAVLAFVITLAPTLGFFDFGFLNLSYVADHFQYLADIGLIALLGAVATMLGSSLGGMRRWAGPVLSGVLPLMLAVLTWQRSGLYKSAETLWRDNVAKNPQASAARTNLGSALVDEGKLDEAIPYFATAVRLNPDYADAHYNWAVALEQQGKLEEAVGHYAVILRADQPLRRASAHNRLGHALAMLGKFDEAIPHFVAAAQLSPGDADVQNNWGTALDRQGKLDEAGEHYATALRINPADAGAHNNLATLFAREGKFDEAMNHFSAALRITPTDVRMHINLGLLLSRQGRLDDARQQFQEAVRLNPVQADAHNYLGKILASQGRVDEAHQHLAEALRLQPDYADAQNNLRALGLPPGK